MSNDISVLFKAQDSLTAEIQKMRASVKEMGKDVADYKAIQDRAFKEKAELQLDLRKAKEELKELAKIEKDGTEESKQNYINKQKEINELTEGIKRYNQAINESNKAERELATTQSRNNNNPNAGGSNEVVSLGAELVKVGMFKELGQSFGNAAGTYLTSAYGEKFGNRVGTMASSVIGGAVMGSVVPGIGTAIGAGLGVIKGGLDIFSSEQKTKDEYFKTSVQNVLSEVNSLSPDIEKGISLAGRREIDMISFATLLGGKENAEKYLKEADKFGADTPFSTEGIKQNAKIMLTFGYKQDELFEKLTKVGDASASLGLNEQAQQGVITALGRMKATDKTSLEYMNMITEKGIDGVKYLAEQMETDKKTVYEMISKGVISGEKASEVIINAMGKEFQGAMKEQSGTYEGLMSTKEDAVDINLMEASKAYTEYRKKFLEDEIAWEEKWGKQIAEHEALMKAKMESNRNELINKYLEETINTEEYKKAQAEGNGAELGRLEMEAKTKAIIEFNNSPEMKAIQESELATIRSTQDYLRENGGFVELGQDIAEQFNRGWASKVRLDVNKTVNLREDNAISRRNRNRRATGGRIPDDYYPFMADKNERVLTANENLEWERNRGKSGSGIIIQNLTLNTALTEDNVKEVAYELAREISNARENIA